MTMRFDIRFDELSQALATISAVPGLLGRHVRTVAAEHIAVELDRRAPVGRYPETSRHPGKYRGSMMVSAGQPAFARLPDQLGGYRRLTVEDVRREVAKFGRPVRDAKGRFTTGGLSVRELLYITNDAASDRARARGRRGYSGALERGHSRQAPLGVFGPTFGSLDSSAIFVEAKRRLEGDIR